MEQVNTSEGRYYTVEGDSGKYWSVTTILDVVNKPFLLDWNISKVTDYIRDNFYPGCEFEEVLDWATGEPRRALKRAGDIGSVVHDAIECFLQSKEMPEMCEVAQHQFMGWFEQFYCKHDVEVVALEQRVFKDLWYCDECMSLCDDNNECLCSNTATHIGYAGTYDALLKVDGVLGLWDWKTSNSLHDEYWMQLSAYLNTLDEHIEEVGIVRMKKNTKSPRAQVVKKTIDELYGEGYWVSFLKHLVLLCDVKGRS